MAVIDVGRCGSVVHAWRKLKRVVERSGVLREQKENMRHIKKSKRKRDKLNAATRRIKRQRRSEQVR